MDSSPLVIDEIYAGREFLERLNEYAPVKAAGWLKRGEDEERYLCVALDGPAGDDISLRRDRIQGLTCFARGSQPWRFSRSRSLPRRA